MILDIVHILINKEIPAIIMNLKDHNLWTALVTPMKSDGSIEFEDLEFLVRKQEEAGNGILLIGSTGEGLALDEDDKRSVIYFVKGLNPSVPIMAGVGGFNLENQVSWIKDCTQEGVDAFLLVTPLYAKPGLHGQVHWFQKLMDASGKPCMLYNIPSRTGSKLQPEALEMLSSHEKLWAVKEASGNIAEYEQFRKTTPDVPLYSGDDGLLPYFSVSGCNGLVSVAANVWPEETSRYTKLCLANETETIFPVWNNAVKALFSAPNPVPAKVLLAHKKWIKYDTVRPPLSTLEVANIEPLLAADKKIRQWFQNS